MSKWREDDPSEAELIARITTAKFFYDSALDDIHRLEQKTDRD